jgi:hypothetical protein
MHLQGLHEIWDAHRHYQLLHYKRTVSMCFWFSKYLKHIMYLGSATHIVVHFTTPNSVQVNLGAQIRATFSIEILSYKVSAGS